MGRAANELGYLPRALLVRQLLRIACNIPHFLYLQNVKKPNVKDSIPTSITINVTLILVEQRV